MSDDVYAVEWINYDEGSSETVAVYGTEASALAAALRLMRQRVPEGIEITRTPGNAAIEGWRWTLGVILPADRNIDDPDHVAQWPDVSARVMKWTVWA